MITYLVSIAVFAVAFVGMAVGVVVAGRRLKGSCGGLSNMRDAEGNSICDACTNPASDCRFESQKPIAGEQECETAIEQ